MCGICGVAGPGGSTAIEERRLLAMRDSMTTRGPDDAGHYAATGIALGSRRLSIVDLSERGRMPMVSADGRYRIVHNGEIYNFKALRADLEARGAAFRSHTDTEVLLQLFAREGPAMLDRLNGMFAFAIWDSRAQSLFIARDRLGVKPLYYAVHRNALYFASEQKALFAAGVPCAFDEATWEELLLFRYVAGERTPYASVRRLMPGHYLLWKDGRVEIRRWWDLAERVRARRRDGDASPNAYRETLRDSIALRLISDVPVGVLLSGGLDSSAVAALAAQTGMRRLGAFTCRFDEPGYDEGPLAQRVAEEFGLSFHQVVVPREDLFPMLETATWLQDEPLPHSSHLHMLAVSRLAKANATVLLSGEGSDETLGGYERYRPLLYPNLLPIARHVLRAARGLPALGHRGEKLRRLLAGRDRLTYVLFNSCEVFPEDLESVGVPVTGAWPYRREVLEEAMALNRSPARQAMHLDQKTFLASLLDRNDRMTMGASIECRVPFLDYRLVEIAGALPSRVLFEGGKGKSLLRRDMEGILPQSILRGRKWGFAVPWSRYLREVPALRALVSDLPDAEPVKSGPFAPGRIRGLVEGFLRGDDSRAFLVHALTMIAMWHQTCVETEYRQSRMARP